MTQCHLTLVPAYGRDYPNARAAIADFLAGKDWYVAGYGGSGYTSVNDLEPGQTVRLRYRRAARACWAEVPSKPERGGRADAR